MEIIFIVVGLFFVDFALLKWNKKANDNIEKIVKIIALIIINIFVIVYLLDRFNLPTKLKLNVNVDTQNWLTIITTCIASIISAAIGGLIAFGIAREQIKENNEILRIENMPMLKYEIKAECVNNAKVDIEHLIVSNCEGENLKPYDLFISIKNAGLNNVKRVLVDFESIIVDKPWRILGKNELISIEKNEIKPIYRFFDLEIGKEYEMKLKVYYEDILQNWYCQIVDIEYNATNISNESYPMGIVNYKVNDEVLLKNKGVPKEL